MSSSSSHKKYYGTLWLYDSGTDSDFDKKKKKKHNLYK